MIMKLSRRVHLLRVFYLSIVFCGMTCADERIFNWDSDITINADATMTVADQLTINVENRNIIHGPKRSFPTRYHDEHGFNYNVGFEVKRVLQDGKSVPFKVVNYMNGKMVYVGDKSRIVMPGIHVYTIIYTTNRQLGFFQNHDELYWNVTGNDTLLIVDKIRVAVHLPEKVKAEVLKAEAYTGTFNRSGQDYKVTKIADGLVQFETTRHLMPREGLTIVVSWPKGIISQPSYFWYYVRDNVHLILLLLTLLALLLFYGWAFFKSRSLIKKGTIIPLFYPPDNAGPGALHFVLHMGYDSKQFAAMLVDLAVKGLMLIEYVPSGWFSQSYYVLKKRTDEPLEKRTDVSDDERKLMTILFANSKQLVLNQPQATLSQASTFLKRSYEHAYAIPFFNSNAEYPSFGALFSACVGVIAAFMVPEGYMSLWFWLLIGLHVVLHITWYLLLPNYTQQGQKFKEEVEGFKMFLSTTETERLKVIGTPPTKTPELYEKYLPYAIALGVEKQWSEQFVPIFKHLEGAGHPYQPNWYYAGHPFTIADLVLLNTGFSNSVQSSLMTLSAQPISSSSSRPGSSSGSGGGGYSGGGGGGGGVGGW